MCIRDRFGIEVARDFGNEPTELDLIGWNIEKTDLRGSGFVMNMGYDEESPGYVGYHPIGGGSAMMGMDALNTVGLKPANYADTSGNPVASKVYRVAKVLREELPNKPGMPCVLLLAGNKEKESLEILHEGLADVEGNSRVEIYGREHVTDTDFIGNRLLDLAKEYRAEKNAAAGKAGAEQ